MNSIKRLKRIRRAYVIFSLFLGIASPLLCWYLIPEFNPVTKPLSYFGVVEPTHWLWNMSLLFVAVALYINGRTSIKSSIMKQRPRKHLTSILLIASSSLFLTSVISMNYDLAHRLSALGFFLSYNLFVFLFGFVRTLKYVRNGLFSITIGSIMLLSSLLVLPFPSYGVFELVYIVLVASWNIVLLRKRAQRDRSQILYKQ